MSVVQCTFSRNVLVIVFNLGYTWYHVKDLPFDQATISGWSEHNNKIKQQVWSVSKSATDTPCLQSWMLCCTFIFFHKYYRHKHKTNYWTNLKGLECYYSKYTE